MIKVVSTDLKRTKTVACCREESRVYCQAKTKHSLHGLEVNQSKDQIYVKKLMIKGHTHKIISQTML